MERKAQPEPFPFSVLKWRPLAGGPTLAICSLCYLFCFRVFGVIATVLFVFGICLLFSVSLEWVVNLC